MTLMKRLIPSATLLILAVLSPRPADAALIAGAVTGTGNPAGLLALLSCDLGKTPSGYKCFVDPIDVQAFSLSFQFDSDLFEYVPGSLEYVAPYTEAAAPDFGNLATGLISHISGATDTPPPGHVFLFSVELRPIDPLYDQAPIFKPFASAGDYVVVQDSETGGRSLLGPGQITTCPEPSALASLGVAAPLTAVFLTRRRRRREARD